MTFNRPEITFPNFEPLTMPGGEMSTSQNIENAIIALVLQGILDIQKYWHDSCTYYSQKVKISQNTIYSMERRTRYVEN
jgi:hypothetical protein